MITTILSIAQIITAIFVTAAILLQAQGSGLGSTWAGGGETYHTKRGVEKIVFVLTIIGIIVFVALSIANLVFQRR